MNFEEKKNDIKVFAEKHSLVQTLKAIEMAETMHKGQQRTGGAEYICHPVAVCFSLVTKSFHSDSLLAASLLHDVLEDCRNFFPEEGKEFITQYNLSEKTLDLVRLLTKTKGMSEHALDCYYTNISLDPDALLIKLADRADNTKDMFMMSPIRMEKYIKETKMRILPIAKQGEIYLPYKLAISSFEEEIETYCRICSSFLAQV